MDKSWTDVAIVLFPWIGGGAAIVLLILLFGTRLLQSEPGSSRWYDRVWLSWLAVASTCCITLRNTASTCSVV